MNKILILKGLPASGKSTFAKSLLEDKKANWIRLNKDDARQQYFDSLYSRERENFIIEMRNMALMFAMLQGYNVVIDDTNFAPQHESEIRKAVDLHNNHLLTTSTEPLPKYEVVTTFINTHVLDCVERNKERTRKLKAAGFNNIVPDAAIWDMYNKYVKGNYPEPAREQKTNSLVKYVAPPDKPRCILVDIDGTLADMHKDEPGKRKPYDWHRVGEDTVIEAVAEVVRTYYSKAHNDIAADSYDPEVILLSGRDAVCRPETEKWLADNNIRYDKLFMRAENDNRKDNIVKKEIFEREIKRNYKVMFVLDDRNQVVDMWRNELGLTVFQVAEGDF